MAIFAFVSIVLILITFATTKERVRPPPQQKTNAREELGELFKNWPWVVLLITSGLLIRTVWGLSAIDPGFVTENVLALRTALPLPKYDFTARRVQYYDRVLEGVRSLPGVRAAAYVTGLPMAMRGGIWPVALAGEDPSRDPTNVIARTSG